MNMIYHYPLPFDYNATSASGIRPIKMLEAFKSLGYTVEVVAGYSKERKKAISDIKEKIKSGVKYDFVYSESSTMPTTMTDPHHLPIHPLFDFLFFDFCKNNNIKIGLFYRDIYWMFDEIYKEGIHPIKAKAAKIAYQFDLLVYQKTLTKLYLPTAEMRKYIPSIKDSKIAVLPPGHLGYEKRMRQKNNSSNMLKIFYVGGILSTHYQMHKLFEVVKTMPEVELTVCTREEEWGVVKHEYTELSENIKIIHKSGVEMERYLIECDIALLFIKPQEYWEFSAPVKIYEYLGFEKPIIASKDTFAGTFVETNNIGWSIDYKKQALKELLTSIINDKNLLFEIRKNIPNVAKKHTWAARAKQVIEDLT